MSAETARFNSSSVKEANPKRKAFCSTSIRAIFNEQLSSNFSIENSGLSINYIAMLQKAGHM
ncbi:hypothetical protein [Sphingobacterium sp. ML3W]|uniref:hypothetical protein n=1 Tax=Sphingobacterium sp. ML3W TaxID=1538644 RepID=UPI001186CAB6|nr:hypothetical protein [Sphingobacterium sp. ML3W]